MEKCLVNHNHSVVNGLEHNEQISLFQDGQRSLNKYQQTTYSEKAKCFCVS